MASHAPILLYHRVGLLDGTPMDEYTVSPSRFAEQMRWILGNGFQPVPLASLVGARLEACPPRALAITFDDGFASNREHAWPVLEQLRIPATTFVVTGLLGGLNDWDPPEDRRFRLLTREEIAMAEVKLMTFASHSATHPNLQSIANERGSLAHELSNSREMVTSFPGSGNLFAYPSGVWTWEVKLAVHRAGYDAACTCMEGLNTSATDPYLLRRVHVYEADTGLRLEAKLRSGRDLLRWPPRLPASFVIAHARIRHAINGVRAIAKSW
jgi:peptidoglycan/xylan/chitin deacetylase (PgdA/CDA1 family)